MAIKGSALAAMGIGEEQVDQIIEMHTQTVNEIKDERDKFKEQAEKLDAVQKELEGLKAEAKNADKSPYKKQFEDEKAAKEALQAEFDKYKSDIEAENAKAAKRNAYRALLAKTGISEKRLDSVLKLAEVDGQLDDLELDESGAVKDADKRTDTIKESYGDYIVSAETRGAQTAQPPASTTGQETGQSHAAKLAARLHANLYGGAEEV